MLFSFLISIIDRKEMLASWLRVCLHVPAGGCENCAREKNNKNYAPANSQGRRKQKTGKYLMSHTKSPY